MTALVCPGRNPGLVAHYEQLRADVLAPPGRRPMAFGLGLFVREGMAGWMRAWAACRRENQGEPDPALSSSPPLSGAARTEITRILAALILGRQEELT